MPVSSASWSHPGPAGPGLRLERLPVPVIHAFARGEVPAVAERFATPFLTGPDGAWLWRIRSEQIAHSPGDADWVARAVMVAGEPLPVGVAGFHGPPDERGMVEVGYRIDPAHRRRGYARRSLQTLHAVAVADPGVAVLRATVSPDNPASRDLVLSEGLVEVGEQWDDEDGLEIIYEISARVGVDG